MAQWDEAQFLRERAAGYKLMVLKTVDPSARTALLQLAAECSAKADAIERKHLCAS